RAVQQLAPFVPGGLGIMELVQTESFVMLGLTSDAGMEMALALRVRFIANLFLSFGALTRLEALAQQSPPRRHSNAQGDANDPATTDESAASPEPPPATTP